MAPSVNQGNWIGVMAWRLSPLLSLLMFQYFHKPLTDKLQYFNCNTPDWAEILCHCLETRDGDVGGYANLGKDSNCCGANWGNVVMCQSQCSDQWHVFYGSMFCPESWPTLSCRVWGIIRIQQKTKNHEQMMFWGRENAICFGVGCQANLQIWIVLVQCWQAEVTRLFYAMGPDFRKVVTAADQLRARVKGERVSFFVESFGFT